MQVFKTALKIIFRFPLYLILYIGFFGVLGIVITNASADALSMGSDMDTSSTVLPLTAVIDRDESEVSKALTLFLEERSTPVAIEDDPRALQDAVALNLATYIIIVPDGFGATFIDAARAGTATPQLETVMSYVESDGLYMDLVLNEYLNALRIAALGSPDASIDALLAKTADAASVKAPIEALHLAEQAGANPITIFFFQWMAYPITNGLIVLTAIIFSTFQSGELRRRNLCAPLSPSAMNLQVAFGCVSMVLLTWVYLILLSLLPQGGGMTLISENPVTFMLLALAALIYAFVPFSIGFLLSQFNLKEMAFNGIGNILSLAFCFVSGIFMGSTSVLGEGVQAAAHFTPTFWYSEAVHSLSQGVTSSSLSVYLSSLGIIALFALAFFMVALIVGKSRAQSFDAGGNPAAEAAM